MGGWIWRRKFVSLFWVKFFWESSYFTAFHFSLGFCFTCVSCTLGQADCLLDSDIRATTLWDFVHRTIPKSSNLIMITVCSQSCHLKLYRKCGSGGCDKMRRECIFKMSYLNCEDRWYLWDILLCYSNQKVLCCIKKNIQNLSCSCLHEPG